MAADVQPGTILARGGNSRKQDSHGGVLWNSAIIEQPLSKLEEERNLDNLHLDMNVYFILRVICQEEYHSASKFVTY